MRYILLVTWISLAAIGSPSLSRAQSPDPRSDQAGFWFIYSAGPVSSGLGGGAALSINVGRARFLHLGVAISEPSALGSAGPFAASVSTGAGLRTRQHRWLFAVAAGPALVVGSKARREPSTGLEDFVGAGAALDAQAFVRVFRGVGVGIEGFGTINGGWSHGAVRVGVMLGNGH